MALRNWLIRGLILAALAALGAGGWVMQSWVGPDRVRAAVLAHLNEEFDGVDVHVGSAHLRIFGGIAVSDLRLSRRGDPPERAFLSVPSAVLYHDKEQLNRGRLVIRKVEFDRPHLRLARGPDGRWNVAGIARPSPPDKPVPTFVARAATVAVEDLSPGGLPPLTLSDATFTLLNDPLPILSAKAKALAGGLGAAVVRARVNRVTGQVDVGVELPDLPLGELATAACQRFAPEFAPQLAGLSGRLAVRADVASNPADPQPLRADVPATVRDGRFAHPDLPWAFEHLSCTAAYADGRVKVTRATAKLGPADVELSLETRPPAAAGSPADDPVAFAEDRLQRLDLSVRGLSVGDELFARLPAKAAKVRQLFDPSGGVDLAVRVSRDASGLKRELEARPDGMRITYEKFKYPVTDLRGWVRHTVAPGSQPDVRVDLIGTAGGQPVTIKGQVYGDGPDPAINVRIAGSNMPIDDVLVNAFPGKYPAVVRQFRAGGRGDFVAEIAQKQGVNLCENEFRVEIRDATVNYERFPYRLEKVKGRLVVRVAASDETRGVRPGEPPIRADDRDEIVLDGFTAAHAGGTVWLHGSRRPIPGGRDSKLTLHVGGSRCPVDADLRTALKAMRLDPVWTTFNPRGELTFAADVEVIDRGGEQAVKSSSRQVVKSPGVGPRVLVPGVRLGDVRHDDVTTVDFDPLTDLSLTFQFYGPAATPSFFAYDLTDLSGWLKYQGGRVSMANFAARHLESRVRLAAGDVRFYPDGSVWANLGDLEVKPLVADRALLLALPEKLRAGGEALNLRGGAELSVRQLVVQTPPDAPGPSSLPPPEAAPAVYPGPPQAVTPVGATRPTARGQSPDSAPPAADPVIYWDAELRLAGAAVDAGVEWDGLHGAIGCRGRHEGTHLGAVRGNVWLDHGAIARQPVSGLKASFHLPPQQAAANARPGTYAPPEAYFEDVAATAFGGTVGGRAWVALDDPTRYELWLVAADVRLEDVARHHRLGSDADLSGVAQGQLRLYNRPDPRTGQLTLEGFGKVDVPAGRMYNLPVLLELVKVLKMQTPDKTAFEEAHAAFRLRADRVYVDQLDLVGAAVCLGGSGELTTDANYLKFEFYTIWSQLLKRWLSTPAGDITALLSKSLFKIKLTRADGKQTVETEMVPLLTEPVKGVLDRLTRTPRAGR